MRAAWDDIKPGLRNGSEFEKVTIYGNKNWQEITARISSWVMPGEVKYFEDQESAVAWLRSE